MDSDSSIEIYMMKLGIRFTQGTRKWMKRQIEVVSAKYVPGSGYQSVYHLQKVNR